MAAVAHSPAFAKKVGIPQSVGKDFNEADKGKKFGRGGMSNAAVQGVNKPKTNHGAEALFSKGGNMATKKMNPRIAAMMAARMASQGAPAAPGGMPPGMPPSAPPGMKKGGMAAFEKSGKDVEVKGKGKEGSKKEEAFDRTQMGMKKGGGVKKMASGGSASSRADGVATKGKTKGTNIVMKNGGKC